MSKENKPTKQTVMFSEALRKELEDTENQYEDLMQHLMPLAEKRELLRSKRDSLRRLLDIESGVKPKVDSLLSFLDSNTVLPFDRTWAESHENRNRIVHGLRGDEMLNAAAEVLTHAGSNHEGMHYREIAKAIVSAGLRIPGKDPASNLLAHMLRDSRFKKSSKRGYYELSSQMDSENASKD
jgi:hypothetical protein